MLNRIQSHNDKNQGLPANVPSPRRSPDDIVELVQPARRPASMRQALPGINCPYPGETWADLNAWRDRYGLDPVTPW